MRSKVLDSDTREIIRDLYERGLGCGRISRMLKLPAARVERYIRHNLGLSRTTSEQISIFRNNFGNPNPARNLTLQEALQ